ncbi:transcription factor IIA subunit alpha [Gnomoniopsis smithogilvyi]|uniref:Transcription initiation factor IIA large subunit n=1 Tax=Gnomoniopsis smithogilvyi TaxID=1191159 RepID=A0A9W8Z419_9PEZI|nr:transcription factor IIA subunit alpha [Gnomoniopsis smithogilvyi]
MSNNLVGNIYRQIIDEVIDSSRVDFEEGGVEEGVLEDLRKGWQMKLTDLKVASFPWDPPPPAPAPAPAAAPVTQPTSGPAQQAGTSSYTNAQLSPPVNAQPQPSLANGLPGPQQANGQQFRPEAPKQEPLVKQEPGLGNSAPSAAPSSAPQYGAAPGGPQNVAAQRAAAQLQNRFGASAAASISAIQGFGQGGQGQGPQRPTGAPGQPPQAQRPGTQAQYAQQLQQQQAQAMMAQQRGAHGQSPGQRPAPAQQNPSQQNISGQNGFQQSQVDGAGDEFEGVLVRRNENGETSEMGRVDIDRMLHQQMSARAKVMEGGGLMLPLKQATKDKAVARKAGHSGPSGFDGGFDDDVKKEELDEDAINSDLDDPNEVDIEEDEDENIDQIMLCMYDKVQRVKNKWKCTLKDGILNVNGKDYVFHKATGEYEW